MIVLEGKKTPAYNRRNAVRYVASVFCLSETLSRIYIFSVSLTQTRKKGLELKQKLIEDVSIVGTHYYIISTVIPYFSGYKTGFSSL